MMGRLVPPTLLACTTFLHSCCDGPISDENTRDVAFCAELGNLVRVMVRLTFASVIFAAFVVIACAPGNTTGNALKDPTQSGSVGKAPVWTKEVLSPRYHIDKKYMSMKGPDALQTVTLLDSPEPELLWIVGYEAVVMDGEGESQVSQEFMCHSNLDVDARTHWDHFGSNAAVSGRLFTLSQGQQNIEFPDGFGIPILSTTPLNLATQVLNLNIDDPNLDVRHQVFIRFVRDRDVPTAMKPMVQAAVQGYKSLEAAPAHYGVDGKKEEPEEHGPGCSVGQAAVAGDMDKDQHGQRFTGHWIVKPGREENRTLVTHFLNLQFDSTIHYIAAHLHPFAESLELFDRTTGETVFRSNVEPAKDKIGIKRLDHFSSENGIPIYKDHQYELVSIYNNTTDQDVDSMAVMFMYLHDTHFEKPDREKMMVALEAQKKKAPAPVKTGM